MRQKEFKFQIEVIKKKKKKKKVLRTQRQILGFYKEHATGAFFFPLLLLDTLLLRKIRAH